MSISSIKIYTSDTQLFSSSLNQSKMISSDQPRLGWFGLGSMGLAMAFNLQDYLIKQDLPALRYSNRHISRGDSLKEIGAIPCQNVGELVQACDVIFISVSALFSQRIIATYNLSQVTNDEVLTSVISQFICTNSLKGKILVDTTTVHPSTSSSLSAQLETHGCSFVAAPVFGPPPAARAGQILIATAGPPRSIEIISPFLKNVIARDVVHAGSDPSKALLLKSTSNFIAAGLQYLLSEAHVLAETAELPASVLEALIGQNFGPYAHNTSRRLTSGSYLPSKGQAPNSALELAIKDVGIGIEVAKEKGVRLEIGELSMGAMEEAKKFGDERERKLDSHSVFGVVRTRAGLSFENDAVKERDSSGKEK